MQDNSDVTACIVLLLQFPGKRFQAKYILIIIIIASRNIKM